MVLQCPDPRAWALGESMLDTLTGPDRTSLPSSSSRLTRPRLPQGISQSRHQRPQLQQVQHRSRGQSAQNDGWRDFAGGGFRGKPNAKVGGLVDSFAYTKPERSPVVRNTRVP